MSKKEAELVTILDRVLNGIHAAAAELDKQPADVTKLDLQTNDYGVTDWDLRKLGGLGLIKSTYFPTEDKELKTIKSMKDDKKYIGKLERDVLELSEMQESIIFAISKNPKIIMRPYVSRTKAKIKRALNLVLSDLHIGSDIKKEETGVLDFGKVEESRRLAKIVQETIEYKQDHRNETELNVMLLGDMIENLLHDSADGAPLAEQFARALHLLSQALGHLSNQFPKVTVYCLTGNHDRNIARHKQRAVSQKWDSIGTMLYYALKTNLASNKNMSFVIPKTPYYVYKVFDKKIFMTHSDTVLIVGNPSSNIKTGTLEDRINSINAALPDNEEYSVFVVGHVHTASCIHLSNGAVLMTNGPLVPPNEFAISLGLFEAACGQYLFESTEGYPVGDLRFIKVGSDTDKDASLDKLIKPFGGF